MINEILLHEQKNYADLSLDGDDFFNRYNRHKTVSFHTLGCKVNQYETQAMKELFEHRGYDILDEHEICDVYVINTCTVTKLSDKKSRQIIRRAKRINPYAIVAVVGCYAQVSVNEIKKISGVNVVIGTDKRSKVVDVVEDISPDEMVILVEDIMRNRHFEELEINTVQDKTRAFLKIQEGCNQYCTYCIIPYARGKIRSRLPENIYSEVRRLVDNGFSEIVLTGIHVASYGLDIGVNLVDVLKNIHDIEGLKRIRFSSLEPRVFTDEFIEVIKNLPKVCRHFHLSLQSGSDKILKKMNRKYTTAEYAQILEKLRAALDRPSFTTDMIVGFPYETDEDHRVSVEFAKKMGFSQIHVFQYSKREGTPAAKFEQQVDGKIKSARSAELIREAAIIRNEYLHSWIGSTLEVICESDANKDGYITGFSERYNSVILPTDVVYKGDIVNVKIVAVEDDNLVGELI